MAADESLKFNFFEIKSNLTGERVDLRSGIARVEYRESVFSPYLEGTGYLADTGNTIADKDDPNEGVGLLDGELAQGTEEMLFEIEDSKGYNVSLAQDANLRLATVSATKQSFQAQTYVITAVSKEAFDNTLVRKRCTMQYSGKISDVVDTIFKKDLESSSTIDIDPTINEYHEWGNKRYPFDMILDLQKLGIPDSLQTSEGKSALGKTAGYLFWQTSTGFHFKSIDKLFDMTDKKIKVFVENKKAALDELPEVSSVNGEGGLTQADGKI